MENVKACCFSGHRKIPNYRIEDLKSELSEAIENLISDGYTYFLAGGALGFDTLAAEAVLEMRVIYPEIKLKLVLPCLSQTNGWNLQDKMKYEAIREKADEIMYISMAYYSGCMHERNRYLVDNSSVCICYLTENKGGTAFTINYAKKKGLEIINLGIKGDVKKAKTV